MVKDKYQVNGQLCIRIYEKQTREPSAVISTNVGIPLKPNEIIVKDYSENEGIYEHVIRPSKLFRETGKYVNVGFCACQIVELLSDKPNVNFHEMFM